MIRASCHQRGRLLSIGATTSVPRNRVDANWHFIDNYSWKAGRHDIKFGYEFRRTTIKHVIDHNFRGTLSFDDLHDFPRRHCPMAAGQITGNTLRHTSENSHGFYIQDSFRLTPRLTLNLDCVGIISAWWARKNNLLYQL